MLSSARLGQMPRVNRVDARILGQFVQSGFIVRVPSRTHRPSQPTIFRAFFSYSTLSTVPPKVHVIYPSVSKSRGGRTG